MNGTGRGDAGSAGIQWKVAALADNLVGGLIRPVNCSRVVHNSDKYSEFTTGGQSGCLYRFALHKLGHNNQILAPSVDTGLKGQNESSSAGYHQSLTDCG